MDDGNYSGSRSLSLSKAEAGHLHRSGFDKLSHRCLSLSKAGGFIRNYTFHSLGGSQERSQPAPDSLTTKALSFRAKP